VGPKVQRRGRQARGGLRNHGTGPSYRDFGPTAGFHPFFCFFISSLLLIHLNLNF
jgi:hypothetical protein